MNDLVTTEFNGGIAIVTMNRGDKRNALCRALITELTNTFAKLKNDSRVRAVVLTGAGTAFCAGMDLTELRESLDADPATMKADAHRLAVMFDSIYNFPRPIVAAVNGPAVAGGAGLMTVCDLAIAVPGAKIGYPEVLRGLVAAIVMPHLLRLVGERTARKLLLTGELIDATEALQIGLINEVTHVDSLIQSAIRLAVQCAQGGPLALAATKRLLNELSLANKSSGELADASAAPRTGDECRGGLSAFFNQQSPPWI